MAVNLTGLLSERHPHIGGLLGQYSQDRSTLKERWGNRRLSRLGQARMDEHQFQKDYHQMVGRAPGLLDYNSLGDMFDGGGPGASGDTFKGARVSKLLNALNVQPGAPQGLLQQLATPQMLQATGGEQAPTTSAMEASSTRPNRRTRRITGRTAQIMNLDPSQYHEVDAGRLNQSITGGGGSTRLAGGEVADHLSAAMDGAARQFDPMGNKPALNDLAKRELGARSNLQQLQLIQQELTDNPALLADVHTMTGRMKQGWLAMRDGVGIDALGLDPDEQEQLANSAAYRQRLMSALNSYIKEITGATVGQGQETARLRAAMPNDSDTPAQLTAKLAGAIETARMDVARFSVMRSTGAQNAPTDAQLRSHLKSTGKAYYEEALRSGADPTAARMQAAQRLSEEFGL